MGIKLDDVILPLKAEDGISGVIGGIVGKVGQLIAVGGAAALAFGTKSFLEAARVDELVVVNNVLAKNAGLAASALQEEAEQVRQMGIEYGASQLVVAKFIQNHLNLAQASDIARVAQDAAVIAGENSTETTERIIHGITTLNPIVLRHAGIMVSAEEAFARYEETTGKAAESLTQFEKQAAFLNLVLERGKDITGAYEAAMREPGKVLRSMPRYINDIFVAVGQKLKPAFGEIVFAMANFTKGLGKALGEGGALAPLVERIGAAFTPFAKRVGDWVENIDWDKVAKGLEPAVKIFEDIMRIADNLLDFDWDSLDLKVSIKALFEDLNLDDLKKGVDIAFEHGIGSIEFSEWANELINKWDTALAEEIDSWDWNAAGQKLGEKISEFFMGSVDNAQVEMSPSLVQFGKGLGELLAGALGVEGGWGDAGRYMVDTFLKAVVILTYSADMAIRGFFDGLASTVTGKISELQGRVISLFEQVGASSPTAMQRGFQTTMAVYIGALGVFETLITTRLGDISKAFFNKAQGWAAQAALGFLSSVKAVTSAVETLVGMINKILKKIITTFTVNIRLGSIFGDDSAGTSSSTGFSGSTAGGIKRPKRRAGGGPVIAGQAYNVAEFYKPEVFVPNTSGRIDQMQNTRSNEVSLDESRLARVIVQALVQATGGR